MAEMQNFSIKMLVIGMTTNPYPTLIGSEMKVPD